MRNHLAAIPVSCLFVLFTSFIVNPGTSKPIPVIEHDKAIHKNTIADEKASSLYSRLNLAEKGLSEKTFQFAYKGYQVLLEKKLLKEESYLTICDFSQSSRKKRLYVINLATTEVVMNTWVAHGRNSGMEYARKFSNKPGSHQSSLGFYVTQQTYIGSNGLSLRLNGVERGINDKAKKRAIVIHGADYIGEQKVGRSYGCPSVPQEENETLINLIKNGTCLFIYFPAKHYLQVSKILND